MPVIKHQVTNDKESDLTATINVAPGRDNHMVMVYTVTMAYSISSMPSVGDTTAPSGGGGSWTAAGNIVDDTRVYADELTVYVRIRVQAWYSYPTSEGDFTLTYGTSSHIMRHSVYSLANASYNYTVTGSIDDDADFSANAYMTKQGGLALAGAGFLTDSTSTNLGYGTTRDHGGSTSVGAGSWRLYYTCLSGKHLREWDSSIGWRQRLSVTFPSASDGLSVWIAHGINSVECSI